MSDPNRYSITVRRVTLDGSDIWQARVKELPDVAEFAETREEATELALDAIDGLMKAAEEEGRPFPPPLIDEEEFSGRVTLRMPPSLHRALATMSEREASSLNQYIVLLLTGCVGSKSLPWHAENIIKGSISKMYGLVAGSFSSPGEVRTFAGRPPLDLAAWGTLPGKRYDCLEASTSSRFTTVETEGIWKSQEIVGVSSTAQKKRTRAKVA